MHKRFVFLFTCIVASVLWQSCAYETIPGPVDCEADPVGIELIFLEDSNCELKDGKIQVLAAGGVGPYRYKLGNNEEQSEALFENLAAGVYEVFVEDENDCSSSMEVTVKNKNGLNIGFTISDAGCSTAQGDIEITPVGGTPPYEFKINDGTFNSSNTFTGLTRGEYNVVVSDASGCEVTQGVKVKSGISFSGSVSEIIKNNCAISGCHSGSQFPDLRVFKNIHDNASQIKFLTGNGSMPQDGTLTQAEINTIACWVDDGAPAN